jgi:hypothetical protein
LRLSQSPPPLAIYLHSDPQPAYLIAKAIMAGVAAPSSRSSFDSFASSNPARRQYNRLKKIAQVNSLDEVWTNLNSDLPTSLDERFINVKKRLVTPEHYEVVQASWDRLLLALEERAKVIESAGPDVRPLPGKR